MPMMTHSSPAISISHQCFTTRATLLVKFSKCRFIYKIKNGDRNIAVPVHDFKYYAKTVKLH